MSRTKNTVFAVIILAALLVASLIYSAVSQSETNDILKNGILTSASPVRIEAYGQSGMSRSSDTQQKYRVVFLFHLNDSDFTVTKDGFDSKEKANSFLNEGPKRVRYLETNPEKARLVE